jgi:hypothetical protein
MSTAKEIAELEAQTSAFKALNEGRRQQLEQCTQVLGGLLSTGNRAKKPQVPEVPEINHGGSRRPERTLLQQSEWVSDPDDRRKAKKAAKRPA